MNDNLYILKCVYRQIIDNLSNKIRTNKYKKKILFNSDYENLSFDKKLETILSIRKINKDIKELENEREIKIKTIKNIYKLIKMTK